MTATEELRRMLDERGVEWQPSAWDVQHETFYIVENGVGFIVTEFPEIGRMSLACDMRITPEQAIDATLGRGTCHNESEYPQMFFYCSECGCAHKRNRAYVDMPRFCPNCGRKVVDE